MPFDKTLLRCRLCLELVVKLNITYWHETYWSLVTNIQDEHCSKYWMRLTKDELYVST